MARPSKTRRRLYSIVLLVIAAQTAPAAQQDHPTSVDLVAALRPALPFPRGDSHGEVPETGGAGPRWFVVWPSAGESRIHVRANPLHRDTQAAGAAAMNRIQDLVVAAERKAQADYERAVEDVRRTGQSADVSGVTLGDEGAEGERIDAELELTIDLASAPLSFDIASSVAPRASRAALPTVWIVRTPANTYHKRSGADSQERFARAEARVLFGVTAPPAVVRFREEPRFTVKLSAAEPAFAVVLRGNEKLLEEVLAAADWSALLR